jgi:hypothetical protein
MISHKDRREQDDYATHPRTPSFGAGSRYPAQATKASSIAVCDDLGPCLYGLAEAEGDAAEEAGDDVGGPAVAGAGETGADESPGAAVGLAVE